MSHEAPKNRLSHETSPYLRQHESNPVDWYPWSQEALDRARREDKPILLSVGYSACHWCHVMAHECFENESIARQMNQSFINIKVDREERPDLDQIYQNVAQIFTRGGGWPLTVFLTPDLKPFFGGTYFPPADRYGRPGFPRVLQMLSETYFNEREKIRANAEHLAGLIATMESVEGASGDDALARGFADRLKTLREFASRIRSGFDPLHGGLQGAPKFPQTMLLSFLWRMGALCECSDDRATVLTTLRRMACGGIFDQLGGGFSRYSVDETWSVPHFEKMLYDNALLVRLYSEVLLSDQPVSEQDRALFLETISKTVTYLLREMRGPEGLFYSAQDADSEGEEGKYFVWDLDDVREALGEGLEARWFALVYGVDAQGNFERHKTVLFRALSIEEAAQALGVSCEDAQRLHERTIQQAWAFREKRIKPGLDDKALTSWNALLVSALAYAAHALQTGDSELAIRAERAARDCYEALLRCQERRDESDGKPNGRLWATRHSGHSKINAYLDDYAFMAQASLDLVRLGFAGQDAVAAAERFARSIEAHFSVERAGASHGGASDGRKIGFYFTSDDHEPLIQRPQNLYDQAIPSGIAVAYEVFLALAELTEDTAFGSKLRSRAESDLSAVLPVIERAVFGVGELLCAAMLDHVGARAIQANPYPREYARRWDCFRKPELDPALVDRVRICHRGVCREEKRR